MRRPAVLVVVLLVLAGAAWVAFAPRPLGDDASREAARERPAVDARPAPAAPAVLAPKPGAAPEPRAGEPAAAAPVTFTGRVVDAMTGTPVAGARIVLMAEFARRETEPTVTSGADGTFRVAVADPFGVDTVLIEATGFAWNLARVSEPARHAAADSTFDLGDLRITRGAAVRGRVVVAPGGAGVSDAALLLTDQPGNDFAPEYARDVGRAGPDGRFQIERVSPPRWGRWVLFGAARDGMGWTTLPATAGVSDVDGVEVAMRPTATLVVRAEDDHGHGVDGVSIMLEPAFSPLSTNGGHHLYLGRRAEIVSLFEATTDASGSTRLDRVPVPTDEIGTYNVVARKSGFALAWTDGVHVSPAKETQTTVVLRPDRRATLSGVVTDREGRPVSGAIVAASDEQRASTGSDGRFSFAGFDPQWQDVTISVRAEGYVPASRRLRLPPGGDPPTQQIRLQSSRPIEGRVVDQHGVPVAGVELSIQADDDETESSEATSDEQGRFRLANVIEGTWRMEVAAPDPHDQWLEEGFATKVKGGDRSLEVVLTRLKPGTTRVHAVVVDATMGEPLSATAGAVKPEGAADRGRVWHAPVVTVDPTGLSAERVKAGAWLFWAQVEGRPPAFARFDVREGDGDLAVKIEVGRPGSVAGRVAFSGGPAPSRASVFVYTRLDESPPWSERRPGTVSVADDGSFQFATVDPGRYRLRLYAYGFVGDVDVAVASAAESHVVLPATAASVLRFRTTGPMPEAVAEFYLAQGDGPFEQVMRLGGIAGKPLDYHHTVAPGPLRWRVVLERGDGSAMRAVGSHLPSAADAAEGAITVGAGETADIEVKLALR